MKELLDQVQTLMRANQTPPSSSPSSARPEPVERAEVRAGALRQRQEVKRVSFVGRSNRRNQPSEEGLTQSSTRIELRHSRPSFPFPSGRAEGTKNQDSINSTTSPTIEESFTQRGFGPSHIVTKEDAVRSPNKWRSALAITSRLYGSNMENSITERPRGVKEKDHNYYPEYENNVQREFPASRRAEVRSAWDPEIKDAFEKLVSPKSKLSERIAAVEVLRKQILSEIKPLSSQALEALEQVLIKEGLESDAYRAAGNALQEIAHNKISLIQPSTVSSLEAFLTRE